MAIETISIVYEPLGSIGGTYYFHETILYTNANGEQFVATSFPTGNPPPENSNVYNL